MGKQEKKIKKITLNFEKSTLGSLFSRISGSKISTELSNIRSIITPEKARILSMIKHKQPNSIYELAKLLARDFKSVRQEVMFLEKHGFLELIPIHKGRREKFKPFLAADSIEITLNF